MARTLASKCPGTPVVSRALLVSPPVRPAVKWLLRLLAVALVGVLAFAAWQGYLRYERRQLRAADAQRAPVPRPTVTGAPAPALPEAAASCVAGLVLREGVPVANARVELSQAHWRRAATACPCAVAPLDCACPEGLQSLLDATGDGPGLVDVEKSTVSDDGGAFTFCHLDGDGPRLAWAYVDADGTASIPEEVTPGVVVKLEVLRRVTLSGVVEDRQREPIAGAKVLLTASPSTRTVATRTDAAGRFSLGAPAATWRLVVGAPGYATRDLEVTPRESPLRVTLTAPAALWVRALQDGAPVEGARVTTDTHLSADTDAEGWARFEGLAPDAWVPVTARKGRALGRAVAEVAEGQTTRAAVTLGPAAVVTGQVLDERDAPVEGAAVSIDADTVDTAKDGTFELPPRPPGAVTLAVRAKACAGRASRKLDLAGDVDVTLHLTCAASLAGTVVDAAAAPLGGVDVKALCGGEERTVTTRRDGTFALAPPPGRCRVEATRTGYRPLVTAARAPDTSLRLVLDAGASVSGVVVDPAGAPVPGAMVAVLPVLVEDLLTGRRELTHAQTDAQGRFVVSGLEPGRLQVLASARGVGVVRELLRLGPGEARGGLTLALVGPRRLDGVVRDEAGKPIAGAGVTVQPPAKRDEAIRDLLPNLLRGDFSFVVAIEAARARTDADGRFTLALAPGQAGHELLVEAEGFESHRRPLPEAGPVEVRLARPRTSRVSGRVLDERGAPVVAFSINRKAFFADDGRFQAPRTGAAIRVEADGFASRSVDCRGPDGKDVDVGDVTLAPAATLAVEARADDGALLDGVFVSVRQAGDASTCVTAQGRCRVGNLAAKKSALTARKDGYETQSQQVEVRVHQPVTVTVTLARAQGVVEGRALGADGRPTPGLVVRLVRFGAERRTVSDEAGAFRFEGLPRGDQAVELREEAGGGRVVRVKVDGGPVQADVGPAPGGAALEGTARGAAADAAGGFVVAVRGAAPDYRGEALLEPDAWLLLSDATHLAWTPARDGRFVLEGLPPGRWAVYLGGLRTVMDEAVKPLAVVDLGPGERRAVEWAP